MKSKLFFTLLWLTSLLFAQQIMVEYKQKQKVDPKSVTVNGAKDIEKAQIEFAQEIEAETTYYQLTAEKDRAIYEFLPSINNDQEESNITYGDEGEVLFLSLIDRVYLQTHSSNFGKFIIKDSLEFVPWEITREKKKVCGFQTRKAIYQPHDSLRVVAWFAPKLPYAFGPQNNWDNFHYVGLPGLILELEENQHTVEYGNNSVYFYCNNLKTVKKPKPLKRPTKGEVVTKKEFEKRWDEWVKKMEEMYRDNGVDTEE